MSEPLHCWKCGASLAGVVLPIGRRDECPGCGADLHVCRQCWFHDPAAHNECREPMADEVADKERSNFCDYFAPAAKATGAPGGEGAAARAKLEAMFGGGDKPDTGGTEAAERAPNEADAAREKLSRLFDKNK